MAMKPGSLRSMTPEERRAWYRAYQKRRMQTDPVFAEARRASFRKWKKKNLKYFRDYNKAHPEPNKLRMRRLASTPRGRARYLVNAAKARAKRRNLEFTITLDDIAARVQRGVCEVTGIEFNLDRNGDLGIKGSHPYCPSIDRIDPSKGYTPENVQVVVFIYNVCKSTFTHEQVEEFARSVVKNKGAWLLDSSDGWGPEVTEAAG